MSKKLVYIYVLMLIVISTISSQNIAYSENEMRIYKKANIDSKQIGVVDAYSKVKLLSEKEITIKGEGIEKWYKISSNKGKGWVLEYNFLKLPVHGLTKLKENSGKWVIFTNSNLNKVSHEYLPEEKVQIVDLVNKNGKIIFNIIHNSKRGWIDYKYIKVFTDYDKRLKELSDYNSFNKPYDSIEDIAESFDDNLTYTITSPDDYGFFQLIFGGNVVTCYKSGRKYRIKSIVLEDPYNLLYQIKVGSKTDYIKRILGTKFSTHDNKLKYEFSEYIFAEPVFTIIIDSKQNLVSRIEMYYPTVTMLKN